MTIRQLSETMINQIAAGEVIERPASVVKELIENSLDAGARHITITTAGGGISLIRVTDDGLGIPANELLLAVGRHCTSKLDKDISCIQSLGFRGEALASIGSVSRMTLCSRPLAAENAAEIILENGKTYDVRPASSNYGTMIEVRDLFFATPARLKFLKGERAEAIAITEMVKKIAIAFPCVRFSLSGSDRSRLELQAREDTQEGHGQRVIEILGKDFGLHSLPLESKRDDMQLTGHISLPRFNRSTPMYQYFFVNGRLVRDKLFLNAVRMAYADLLPKDRYPMVVLFLSIHPENIDVNVHPAKTDVRFRSSDSIRRFLYNSIQEVLTHSGLRPFPLTTQGIVESFTIEPVQNKEHIYKELKENPFSFNRLAPMNRNNDYKKLTPCVQETIFLHESHAENVLIEENALHEVQNSDFGFFPLGMACAQIYENYIIAQTKDSLIIVDQHAAHERLMYEDLKKGLENNDIQAQILLSPEIIALSEEYVEKLLLHKDILECFGLTIERFGPEAVAVRSIPNILKSCDIKKLIEDLIDEINEHDTVETIKKRLHEFVSKIACYYSVRSGRRLKNQEMNALLRQMESMSNSSMCNHGRPTYIELKLVDLEKLFLRH